MRIGLFTDQYSPLISGVVTSIKMLYDGLTSMGHECYVFTSCDKKKYKSLEITDNIINIKGRPYPFKALKDYRYSFFHRKALKIVKKFNLDIIHVHTEFNMGKIAKKASKKFNIPMVHTLHTLWTDYLQYVSPFFSKHFKNQMLFLLRRWFTGPISKQSIFDIVPTEKTRLEGHIYGLADNVKIIPTGIDIEKFNSKNFTKENVNALKEKLGIKKNQFVFLYIGRVSQEKKINVLLNAYSKACKGIDNAVLLIVGDGPDLKSLKKLAYKLGIQNNVIFTGAVAWDEIALFYQLGNIFVNASQSETQGLTYIEALASSIPLLIQKDDCILNIVEDYYNGIYFDGEDDLALKMEEMLKATTTLKKIKANTLKSIQGFSKEAFCNKILNVYEEAIKLSNK